MQVRSSARQIHITAVHDVQIRIKFDDIIKDRLVFDNSDGLAMYMNLQRLPESYRNTVNCICYFFFFLSYRSQGSLFGLNDGQWSYWDPKDLEASWSRYLFSEDDKEEIRRTWKYGSVIKVVLSRDSLALKKDDYLRRDVKAFSELGFFTFPPTFTPVTFRHHDDMMTYDWEKLQKNEDLSFRVRFSLASLISQGLLSVYDVDVRDDAFIFFFSHLCLEQFLFYYL